MTGRPRPGPREPRAENAGPAHRRARRVPPDVVDAVIVAVIVAVIDVDARLAPRRREACNARSGADG